MIRKSDSIASELPLSARQRVRLADNAAPGRIFHGWGPGLGR